jgi:hypothetical protein
MKQYHANLYGPNTPLALIEFIEEELAGQEGALGFHRRNKIIIDYGNPLTGRAWADNATGYLKLVGCTPPGLVLLKTPKSKVGTPVLMNNVVRVQIAKGGIKYRHPLYHTHLDKPLVIEEENTDGRALRRISLGRHGSTAEVEGST